MKVVAIGRTEILYDSIKKLECAGHEIVLIITGQEVQEYKKGSNDFKWLSEYLGINFIKTENINATEIIDAIKNSKADIAISVNWKTIIGQSVIDCFKYGIVNAHLGDLPRYRGNAVGNWAILSGESHVALSLHLMTLDLDSGPILMQKKMPLNDTTRIGEVYEFIQQECPDMFIDIIKQFNNGSIKPHIQSDDPSLALRCYPRMPRDGEINWNQNAVQIDRLIRASSEPFEGAYTFIGIKKMIIHRAHIKQSPTPFLGIPGQVAERRSIKGEVVVITGDGLLVLEEIEMEDKGRKKASDIIKSIRTRLGMDYSNEILHLNIRFAELEATINKHNE